MGSEVWLLGTGARMTEKRRTDKKESVGMRIRFSSPAKKTVRINAFSGGVDYRSNESVGSAARAIESYNFDFSVGTLKAGYGLESRGLFSVPVAAAWEFTRYDHYAGAAVTSLLFVSTSGELY